MPDIIEFDGELARIIRREVLTEARVADIMPFIETRVPIHLPSLPTRTRQVYFDPRDQQRQLLHVLMEMDPGVRTLTMARDRDTFEPVEHKIALPYTVFHFAMTSPDPAGTAWSFLQYRCFFAQESVKNPDTIVIPALLPNVFADGAICFGDTGVGGTLPISDRLDQVVNEWYLSNFNNIGHTRPHYLPWGSRNFDKWVRKTERDPFCWKKFPEWDPTTPEGQNHNHYRAGDLFGQELEARTVPKVIAGSIPDLNIVPTFGMADQWFDRLTPTQRHRIKWAVDNYTGEITPEPDPTDDDTPDNDDDDA